jgi:predicted nucleotidyltransferase
MPGKLDFITPTLVTVLELFLSDPMQEYHEREVIRKTRVSKGSANRILRLLSGLGFLSRERKGRMVFYRLNRSEAVVRQFKVLATVYALKELIDRVKEECRRIVLFGSCAQGTDTKDSDIDLFVLTSTKTSVRKSIGDFGRKSERKITPIVADVNEFARMKREDKTFYDNIERGILLWEKE